jgi:hypothetical protein
VTPEEQLAADLTSGPFLLGEDHGRWRLVGRDGITAYVAILAPPRSKAPDEYVLRLLCRNYRTSPATGVFWDMSTNAILADDLWPILAPPDESFKTNWQVNGERCLYIATDGLTLIPKTAWSAQFPLERWRPEIGIASYLEVVRDRLYSSRYIGISRTQSAPAA